MCRRIIRDEAVKLSCLLRCGHKTAKLIKVTRFLDVLRKITFTLSFAASSSARRLACHATQAAAAANECVKAKDPGLSAEGAN